MANREQKRRIEKQNKGKVINKEEKKKSFIEKKFGLNEEMSSFINTLIVVFIGFIVVLIATLLLGKVGAFDAGYTKPVKGDTVISYEEILIGNVFNKKDYSYYVIFDDFTSDTYDVYLSQKISEYTGKEPIYKVDMAKGINEKYKSDESNKGASKTKDLKIKGPTLIKIVDGKNNLYIEGTENIINELFK